MLLLRQLRSTLAPYLEAQEIHPRSRLRGAYINPNGGLDDPSHVGTAALLAGCLRLAAYGAPADRAHFSDRALLASRYLLRAQRPSGLIDYKSCNFDSSPDTAFVVQLLCAEIELLRLGTTTEQQALLSVLETFIRRAVVGLLGGGFHTPNHRWVIASALAWAAALWPDLQVHSVVKAYCDEGVDQDRDGAFQERSVAVYDAVSDRSLWLLARHAAWKPARKAIDRNLSLALDLLNADGTAETGCSLRQDRHWRSVPSSLAHILVLSGKHAEADWLWSRTPRPLLADCLWLDYALRIAPRASKEPASQTSFAPPDFSRNFPALGLWRLRRGKLSVSAFRDDTRLLRLVQGAAELRGLRISQSYFGVGRFCAERLQSTPAGVRLLHSGTRNPRRPAYELPLGIPVPVESWEETLPLRALRRLPPAGGILEIQPSPKGLQLLYQSTKGLDGVPAQIALDFAPGGTWSDGGRARKLLPGETVFLKSGYGEMHYGRHLIRIGPGAGAHTMLAMRDAEGPGDCARVLLTFLTPVRHRFTLAFKQLSPSRL